MIKKVSIVNMFVLWSLCVGIPKPIYSAFLCDDIGEHGDKECESLGLSNLGYQDHFDRKIAELSVKTNEMAGIVLATDSLFTFLSGLIVECRVGEEWTFLKAVGEIPLHGFEYGDFLNNVSSLELGETLLMIAARAGHLSIVKTLLLKGADPFLKDSAGQNIFFYAAQSKKGTKKEIMNVLFNDIKTKVSDAELPAIIEILLEDAFKDENHLCIVVLEEGGVSHRQIAQIYLRCNSSLPQGHAYHINSTLPDKMSSMRSRKTGMKVGDWFSKSQQPKLVVGQDNAPAASQAVSIADKVIGAQENGGEDSESLARKKRNKKKQVTRKLKEKEKKQEAARVEEERKHLKKLLDAVSVGLEVGMRAVEDKQRLAEQERVHRLQEHHAPARVTVVPQIHNPQLAQAAQEQKEHSAQKVSSRSPMAVLSAAHADRLAWLVQQEHTRYKKYNAATYKCARVFHGIEQALLLPNGNQKKRESVVSVVSCSIDYMRAASSVDYDQAAHEVGEKEKRENEKKGEFFVPEFVPSRVLDQGRKKLEKKYPCNGGMHVKGDEQEAVALLSRLDMQLHRAVESGQYGLAMHDIEKGANPYAGSPTALEKARKDGRNDIAVSMGECFMRVVDEWSECKKRMFEAARSDDVNYIKNFFDRFHTNEKVNTVVFSSRHSQSEAGEAVASMIPGALGMIQDSQYNSINCLNEAGETPLFVAIKNGHMLFADTLLELFPIAAAGLRVENKYGQDVVSFLFDFNKRVYIAQEVLYVPEILMPLLRDVRYMDSLAMLRLVKNIFPKQSQVPIMIPAGMYGCADFLNMASKKQRDYDL